MNNDNPAANATSSASERTFVMERIFNAPRELVFQAYSDCQHLIHWWGPTGWTLPVCEMDFRVGGSWFYCMRGPNGEDSCGKAFYLEIVAPERFVYRDTFVDTEGNQLEEMPELTITVIFEEVGGKTKLITRTEFASAADLKAVLEMGMAEGFTQTLDRLEAYLVNER